MKGKIAVCDSGVGGVAVLIELVKKFPDCSYLYLSDSKNMPYGNKNTKQIETYAIRFIEKAKKWGADVLVIACNTLALNGKKIFEKYCEIPVFYVLPNIKKIASLSGQTNLLFCTERSAKSPDIRQLSNICSCCVVPCKTLAESVEKNVFDLDKVDCSFLAKYGEKCDNLFLGCTHYIFVKEKFEKILKCNRIFDGVEDMLDKLQKYINSTDYLKQSFKVKFTGSGAMRMKRVFFFYKKP